MKKALMWLAVAGMFAACNSDIEYTEPDNKTDEIQFSIASIDMAATTAVSKAATRAGEHNHIAWDDAIHANTLGVFGYCDGTVQDANKIFSNQKVTYADSKWGYQPPRYWPEFTQFSSFDFFGYMVENATDLPAATLVQNGNQYTLSFPASISSPILSSPDNTPLICHAPHHTTVTGNAIPFQMDQTLTGYSIQFQLGEKMSAIRKFVIKSVKIYGDNLPTGGTISRTYTLTNGTWASGNITWSGLSTSTVSKDSPFVLAENWMSENTEARTVPSTSTSWLKWGGEASFYTIPSASFTPTIEVTYDVYANDDQNSDGTTITRKDVTSNIVLNNTNFANLNMGYTGEVHPIRIKIVPDYLYVLSDDDQTTSYLIVNK